MVIFGLMVFYLFSPLDSVYGASLLEYAAATAHSNKKFNNTKYMCVSSLSKSTCVLVASLSLH